MKTKTWFKATMAEAVELGYSFEVEYDLSRDEAQELEDYYDKVENCENAFIGVLIGIISYGANKALKSLSAVKTLGIDLGIGTIYGLVADQTETLDNIFDEINSSDESMNKVKYTYKFVRTNMFGGAFLLDDCKVIS